MNENIQEMRAKMESRAQAMLSAVAKGEYRNAVMHFNTLMTSVLPAQKLEEMWTAITAKAGAFVEQTAMKGMVIDGKPVVALLCKFEKGNLAVHVTFDDSAHVMGLHFSPAEPSVVADEEADAESTAKAAAPRARDPQPEPHVSK